MKKVLAIIAFLISINQVQAQDVYELKVEKMDLPKVEFDKSNINKIDGSRLYFKRELWSFQDIKRKPFKFTFSLIDTALLMNIGGFYSGRSDLVLHKQICKVGGEITGHPILFSSVFSLRETSSKFGTQDIKDVYANFKGGLHAIIYKEIAE